MFQRESTFKDLSNLNLTAVRWIALTLGMILICLVANPAHAACNSDNSLGRNSGMSEIVILDSDQGKTFEVQAGDLIAIRLPENPTTGYRWEISGVDNQLVEFPGSDYSVAPGSGTGGGGTRTFHFRAKSTGTAQIQLRRRRSWEPETRGIEQFTVNIQVQ